jgi:hypothetical protein
MVGAATT